LGLFKFQFVLPLAFIFLLRKKWRFLAGFGLSAVVLGILSLLAVGGHGILEYIQLLYNVGQHPANESFGSAIDMPTLHGFIYAVAGRALGPGGTSLVVGVLSGFLILIVAWWWRQSDRQSTDASLDLMFAGAVIISLVTGSHMFTHDFSPLLLAMFLVVVHFPSPGRRALRLVLAVALVLFWTPPVYFILVAWHGLYMLFPVLIVFGLAALRMARIPAEGILEERSVRERVRT
jgi:hypothetical protein